jgi:hypothetical protein
MDLKNIKDKDLINLWINLFKEYHKHCKQFIDLKLLISLTDSSGFTKLYTFEKYLYCRGRFEARRTLIESGSWKVHFDSFKEKALENEEYKYNGIKHFQNNQEETRTEYIKFKNNIIREKKIKKENEEETRKEEFSKKMKQWWTVQVALKSEHYEIINAIVEKKIKANMKTYGTRFFRNLLNNADSKFNNSLIWGYIQIEIEENFHHFVVNFKSKQEIRR